MRLPKKIKLIRENKENKANKVNKYIYLKFNFIFYLEAEIFLSIRAYNTSLMK